MKLRHSLVAFALAILSTFFSAGGMPAAEGSDIEFSLRERLRPPEYNSSSYDLTILGPSGLVAPDGTPITLAAQNLTLDDFNSRFAGTWTLTLNTLPTESIYTFTLFPIMADIPSLFSPTDGATVGPTFVTSWDPPELPIRGNVLVRYTPPVLATFGDSPDENSAVINVDLAGQASAQVTLRAARYFDLEFGPIVHVSGPPNPPGPRTVSGTFTGLWSAPVTVTVVPEPSSFVIAAVGLIGLATWGCRRKRRAL